MKVYLVEDSPIVQERLVALLSEIPDIEVVGAADNPAEALFDIQRLQPDAAVVDVRLRGGSGIEVLRGMRRMVPGILAIVLTNYAGSGIRERCLGAGADHFFDKTEEFDRLRIVLERQQTTGTTKFRQVIQTEEDSTNVRSRMPLARQL